MPHVIYGIRNCDTMKKAFAWLDGQGVAYRFHDYRKDGLDAAKLQRWSARLGWEALLNKRGTTWRKLDAARQALGSEADAIALMLEQPSLIRRPVLETADDRILVGFDADLYSRNLHPGSPT